MRACHNLCVWAVMLSALCPGAPLQATWAPAGSQIKTRWAQDVTPENALPDYPRPQMVRKDWRSLNGLLTIDRTGRLLLSYDTWSTYWFYRNDHPGDRRALLVSPDGGQTWKLAETSDLAPNGRR